jgi:UDP-glucose 4-epimerase
VKILITGGSGFLGSRFIQLFSDKYEITATSRSGVFSYLNRSDLRKIRAVKCDITDKRSVKTVFSRDFDVVLHAAAEVSIAVDGKCPKNLFETNVSGTINILDAAIDSGSKKLIFCSSMTVYSPENTIPVREDSLLSPIHFYGLSKKCAEDVIKRYAANKYLKALILRFPGLYGLPRRSGYVCYVAGKMMKNMPVEINTTGLKFWEAMYIDDALNITERLIWKFKWKRDEEILNCSYGKETDIIKTAYKIKEKLCSKSKINVRRPLDYKPFYMSNKKIKFALGGGFKYSFDNGLSEYLAALIN